MSASAAGTLVAESPLRDRFGRSGCIERSRRVWLLSFPVLSPVALVLRIHCASVLEGGNSVVSSAAPGVTVGGDGGPPAGGGQCGRHRGTSSKSLCIVKRRIKTRILTTSKVIPLL